MAEGTFFSGYGETHTIVGISAGATLTLGQQFGFPLVHEAFGASSLVHCGTIGPIFLTALWSPCATHMEPLQNTCSQASVLHVRSAEDTYGVTRCPGVHGTLWLEPAV